MVSQGPFQSPCKTGEKSYATERNVRQRAYKVASLAQGRREMLGIQGMLSLAPGDQCLLEGWVAVLLRVPSLSCQSPRGN